MQGANTGVGGGAHQVIVGHNPTMGVHVVYSICRTGSPPPPVLAWVKV